MALIALIVGGAVAGGTYLFAKNKKASTGQSAVAGAATGALGYGVTAGVLAILSAAFWPIVLVGGAVAGGYALAKKKEQKALPPASEG